MTDSVVSSLAARVRSNTVAKDSTTEFDETLDSFDPHESHAPLLNTVQSPLVSDDQGLVSSDSNANYTLRQLRSKKITSLHPTVSELKKSISQESAKTSIKQLRPKYQKRSMYAQLLVTVYIS